MATTPRSHRDDDDDDFVLPDEGEYPELQYTDGSSLSELWQGALASIRQAGVEGRDHQVALAAMAVARFRSMGRVPRILIVASGPGQGKSQLLNAISRAMGRTVVSIPGAALSPSGWEGLNVRTVMSTAAPRSVIAIDELQHAVCLPPRCSGNTVERLEHLAGDIAGLLQGLYSAGAAPPVVATASLPRLRIGAGGDLSPDVLREAGMHASVASLWTPLYLPPLTPAEVGWIVAARANSDAALTGGMCGYDVVWSALALRTLQRAAVSDPTSGVRLGLSLVARTIENALIGGLAMGIRPGGRIGISPEHVPAVPEAPPMDWDDHERGTYGVG